MLGRGCWNGDYGTGECWAGDVGMVTAGQVNAGLGMLEW